MFHISINGRMSLGNCKMMRVIYVVKIAFVENKSATYHYKVLH